VKSSGTKAVRIEAAKGVKPLKGEDDGHGHGHHHGHDGSDPHAWQSIGNAKTYIVNIRDALIAADAAGRQAYEPMPAPTSSSSTRSRRSEGLGRQHSP
jgi:zinc/manganese transport system substrate-binding protein